MIKFIYPGFLFALFAVAIPIIIHFFSFRKYKTIYFSNVSFLKNIKKESRKKSQLKQILMLIARILAIASLVLAFSQPYIPVVQDQSVQPNPVVGIYIDNSFSMNALSEKGRLIEAVRNKAAEIAMAYNPGTKFRLITNDMEPRHQHYFSREQIVQLVSDIDVSPNAIPLSRIVNRLTENIGDEDISNSGQIYLLSDFQRKVTDLANLKTDSLHSFFLMSYAPKAANNLYIDTCWAEIPAHQLNQQEELMVKIINRSGEDYQNLPLKLYLNDSLKSMSGFNIQAQGEVITSLKYTNFTSGMQLGKLEITDYPFTHDNEYYISYNVQPNLSVLLLHSDDGSSYEGLKFLKALYQNDEYIVFEEKNSRSFQISQLINYNAIILINLPEIGSGLMAELEKAVKEGLTLIVFPELKKNFEVYNQFISRFGGNKITGIDSANALISGINFSHPVYSDVFRKRENNVVLPAVDKHYQFSEAAQIPETNLLWFRDGKKALSSISSGKGRLYLFSFPLNNTNRSFAEDILFVPTLYNLVLNSLPQQEIGYVIGKNQLAVLQGALNQFPGTGLTISNPKTGYEFIPEIFPSEGNKLRISFGSNIREAGHYLLMSGGKSLASFAFNYDRSESDLQYFREEELKSELKNCSLKYATVLDNTRSRFSEVLEEISQGIRLWKWFIFAALFFLLAEALISRFMK